MTHLPVLNHHVVLKSHVHHVVLKSHMLKSHAPNRHRMVHHVLLKSYAANRHRPVRNLVDLVAAPNVAPRMHHHQLVKAKAPLGMAENEMFF